MFADLNDILASNDSSPKHIPTFHEMKIEYLPILINLDDLEAQVYKNEAGKSGKRTTKSKINKKDHKLYRTKITQMREKLLTQEMKAVFVGQQSCGKTTVIDALLGSKIIPCEMGDSTNCFISVKSSSKHLKAYVSVSGTNERQDLANLKDVLLSLSDSTQMVDIDMPKSSSEILDFPVTIIDSPGIDFSKKIDRQTKEYCEKATVLVIVLNYRSTISEKEKKFYRKVKSKMVEPLIFIVYNLCDSLSDSFNILEERQKQLDSASQFLADDLKCVTKHGVEKRIFFISGMEALQYNSKEIEESATSPKPFGYDVRKSKFNRFVTEFKKTLSDFIITSNFQPSCDESLSICSSISDSLKAEVDELSLEKGLSIDQLNEIFFNRHEIEAKLHLLCLMQDQIPLVSEKYQRAILGIVSKEFDKLKDVGKMFVSSSLNNPNSLGEFQKIISNYIFDDIKVQIDQAKESFLSSEMEKFKNDCKAFFQFIPADIVDKDKWHDLEEAIEILLTHSPFDTPLFNKICPDRSFTIYPSTLSIFTWILSIIDKSQHYFETSRDQVVQMDASDSMYQKFMKSLKIIEFFQNNNSVVPEMTSAILSEISRCLTSKFIASDNVTPDSLLGNMMHLNDDKSRYEAFMKQMLNYAEQKLVGIFEEISTRNTQLINIELKSIYEDLNKILFKRCQEYNRLKDKLDSDKNEAENIDSHLSLIHSFRLYQDSIRISAETHSFAEKHHIKTIN